LHFTSAEGRTTYYVYAWTEDARLGLGQYMESPAILTFDRAPGTFELGRDYRVAFTVDLAQKNVSASMDGNDVLTLKLTPPVGRTSMWISTGVQTEDWWHGPQADVTYDDVVVEAR
jgi:hypothetical protein